MTLEEFVKLDPSKVRRDSQLMQLFVDFYKAAFFVTPNCVGCVFKSGFQRLKKYATNKNKNINFEVMSKQSKKTFQVKSQFRLKILSFRKEGKVYRSYGYNMTEEFAEDLAKYGNKEVFSTLPQTDEEPKQEVSKYDTMDYREEVLPLYGEVRERTGKKADSTKKEDIIKFLEENNND